jgi:sugar O-acyltransferase (sialic acid O-acetyltransferase NeuD family)
MIALTIPTTDVNSEAAMLLRWYVEDRAHVRPGDAVAEIETSKAIIDIEAPGTGVLLRLHAAGERLPMDQPLGYLFDDVETLERFDRERDAAFAEATPSSGDDLAARVTAPARRRAAALGLDLDDVARSTDGLVTTKIVEAFAEAVGSNHADLPDPLNASPGVRRLVVIGAGLGANQVLDILLHDSDQAAIAIVDEDRGRVGELIDGVPVIGGVDRALDVFAKGGVDAAVIAVGTSTAARARLREVCERAGLPLANVIDPSVRLCRDVRIGTGNIICAHCHFGVGAVIGDNNLISAHNSFDHHSEIGSDVTTGPGCVTSGLVRIGDRCRLGMGISVEPKVSIGTGAEVASGSVIVSSVPPDHAVKTKIITTVVVPRTGV